MQKKKSEAWFTRHHLHAKDHGYSRPDERIMCANKDLTFESDLLDFLPRPGPRPENNAKRKKERNIAGCNGLGMIHDRIGKCR